MAAQSARAQRKCREIREPLLEAMHNAGLPLHQINVVAAGGTLQIYGWIDTEAQRQAMRVVVSENRK